MKRLLMLVSVLETATGLALMIAPSLVTKWLLGADLSGAGAAVGRVAGFALVSLGLVCWPGREDVAPQPAAALRAMLTYNLLITCYLMFLGIGGRFAGVLLWPAAALHGVLTLLLARQWLGTERPKDVGLPLKN